MSNRSHPESGSSRRQFLTRGAALAGAAAAAPTVLAAGQKRLKLGPAKDRTPLGADETIRIGVIGTGGMGTAHCRSIVNLAKSGQAKVHISALADVCKPRLDSAKNAIADQAEDLGVTTHRDYKELLEREDLHGILIASPEHWHAQMAVDAILAGKDVYVEKPMTLHLSDALELRDVVKSHDNIFQVGTQYMSDPMYRTAMALIADGKIGHPTCSQTSYCRNTPDGEWNYYGVNPDVVPGEMLDWEAWCGPKGPQTFDTLVYHRWRRYKAWSTGVIGDLLVHQMTPLMMAVNAGWPTKVTAVGGHLIDKEMENHDQVNIAIEFERGHTMIVMGSTCNATGLPILVRGHEGNMSLGSNRVKIDPERAYVDDVDPMDVACENVPTHDAHRLNWFSCMRTREPAIADVDTATMVMVVVDLATRALWDGGTYLFDPATMRVARS